MSIDLSSCYFLIFAFFLPRIPGNITYFGRSVTTLGQKPLYSEYDYILAYSTYDSDRKGSCGFPIDNQSAMSSYNITTDSGPSLSPSFSSPVFPSSPPMRSRSRSPSQSPSQSPIRRSRSPSPSISPSSSPSNSPSSSFSFPKTAGSLSSNVSGPGTFTLMELLSGMIMR